LKLIVNDKITEVRKSSYENVAKMLNGLSVGNLKNYEASLVCLLVNGLSDENEDIALTTQKLLEDVGLKRKLLALELSEPIEEF
jgi:hypothetical protein